jgi:Na+/H+ antiporter NhaD/arsenite permease-like protein
MGEESFILPHRRPMSAILAIILFIINYIILFLFPHKRAITSLSFAVVFIILGLIPLNQVIGSIQWNALMMLAGTMGLVSLLIESNMPAYLADVLIEKMPNVRWTIVALSVFAGLISAFVDNVATVLMIAPLVLSFSKKVNISPVVGMISIAIFSNLQGAATLVGDTTSILLGEFAKLSFFDFFFVNGEIGMFWIIQFGTLGAALLLIQLLKSYTQATHSSETTTIKSYIPSVLLGLMLVLLMINSFIENSPSYSSGAIVLGLFVIGNIIMSFKQKSWTNFKQHIINIDYFTLALLTGLFIMIGGLNATGVIYALSQWFLSIGSNNIFLMYSLLVWSSVIFSAFIDNIPYVASMLPVVSLIASQMAVDPNLFYFGLLMGATLGGNLSPLGASANVTALGILRQNNEHVKATTFMKIGVPITLVAVLIGYITIWLIYSV